MLMDRNERDLQRRMASAHPMFSSAVIQAQPAGLDLVLRLRFPNLVKTSPTGVRHEVTTEHRFEGGMIATNQAVRKWLEGVATDCAALAHHEAVRHEIKWPAGWPVPAYTEVKAD